MNINLDAIDPLIRKRVEIFKKSFGTDLLNNTDIVGPAFFRPQSTVFNAVYWQGKERNFREIFVEFTSNPCGCSLLHLTLSVLQGIPGIPKCFESFKVKENGIVTAAVAYEKFCGAIPYENFLDQGCEEAPFFFSALKELIERVHARKVLLPAAWRSAGILFASASHQPVFISFNNVHVRTWSKYQEFIFGCRQDWLTLLFLIRQQEKTASQTSLPLLQHLEAQVKAKLEAKAIA
jgi:hypothetical protein